MLLVVFCGLAGCDWFEAYTYRAEVGYYESGQQAWYVGADKTREACTSEAVDMFNSFNAQSPNRAFSWACRKMQGERFLERVR
jgi:hypothetical protein